MERAGVVVLKGHSLLLEGVISRLKDNQVLFELNVVDAEDPHAVAQIVDLHPFAVIFDQVDIESSRPSIVTQLLSKLPALKLIRLDPRSAQMQLIQWEWKPASRVNTLVEWIRSEKETQAEHALPGGVVSNS